MLILKSHPATRTAIGGDPTPDQAASGDYPKLRQDWHGLRLAIEHPEGTVREGVDETGKPWRTVFKYAYGEIIGTTGMDGDPVDVFIGQDSSATHVYIVQQMKRKQWDKADEQKCMIDFSSEDDAKTAYLNHYDDPRFFGGITAMPVDEFVRKVRATRDKPAMVKAAGFGTAILFFKSHVGAYVRNGKLVNLAGYRGRDARPDKAPGQIDLFTGREHGATPPLGPNPYVGKHPVKDTPDLFGDKVVEPRQEMIAEHRRLVAVLRSPSHEDDKREADRQEEELKEYEGGEHDHLLRDIPGAKWRRGKGLIAGHYGVEVNGEVVGNYHKDPADAVSAARSALQTRADFAEQTARRDASIEALRGRIKSGAEPTDADLSLLGLKPGRADLRWFIPAAAELFGISSRQVRPAIADLIRTGHTDMGAKRESVDPRLALVAMAAKQAPTAAPEPAVTPAADLPTGATIADSKGRQYRVHYMRHGLIVAHPIVDGKPQVSADTTVRFETTKDFIPSGDNDRTDPVTVVEMPDGYRMDGGRAVRATEH